MKTIAAFAALELAYATRSRARNKAPYFSDDDDNFASETHFIDEGAIHKKTALRGARPRQTAHHAPHPPQKHFADQDMRGEDLTAYKHHKQAAAHKVMPTPRAPRTFTPTHQDEHIEHAHVSEQHPHMDREFEPMQRIQRKPVHNADELKRNMPVADLKFGDYYVTDSEKKLHLQQKHEGETVSSPTELAPGFLARSALHNVTKKECDMPVKSLRIFVDTDFRPMVRSNLYTSWGFDYELIDQACTHAGLECSVITDKWQNVWPGDHIKIGHGFVENDFDCSSSTYNTPQRRTLMRFSDPYLQPLTASLVTRPGHCPAVCTTESCTLQSNETIGYVRGYAHDDSVHCFVFYS